MILFLQSDFFIFMLDKFNLYINKLRVNKLPELLCKILIIKNLLYKNPKQDGKGFIKFKYYIK